MTLPTTKYGSLEMGFSRGDDGRTILHHIHRRVPLVVQQALYFDEQMPRMACVYIRSSGGPVVEGDRLSIDVDMAPHTEAHISTAAATVVGIMEEGTAELRQRISLDEGAYLEWLPRQIIPSAGSRYRSQTELIVDPTATCIISEVVACGRKFHGEIFDYGYLHLASTIARPTGEVVAREAIRLEPRVRSPEEWALLGPFSHFASVLIVAPSDKTRALYDSFHPTYSEDLRLSVALLGGGGGIQIWMLGHSSEALLSHVRRLASVVRTEIKGSPLPPEFAWR